MNFQGETLVEYARHAICPGPPRNPMVSERGIELALAMRFLREPRVVEVGAVTPYYWPGAWPVLDIADSHPRAIHVDARDVEDWTGHRVLSISTLEHVEGGADLLLQRIYEESEACLITVPVGWRAEIDAGFASLPIPRTILRRGPGGWSVDATGEYRGTYGHPMPYANTLAVFSKP